MRVWFWQKKWQLWREFPGRFWHDLRWNMAGPRKRLAWVRQAEEAHPAWLFLVGLNNSGTTLLSGLLGRFPEVSGLPGEGQKLSFGLPRPGEYGLSRAWGHDLEFFGLEEHDDARPSLRLKYDWSFHLPPRSTLALVKCTQYAVRTRWLQGHFAGARFVGIVRHPFAVCEGIRRRADYPLDIAARHWVIGNERMLADFRHLERRCLVRYEDLCDQPVVGLAGLGSFLDCDVEHIGAILDHPVDAPTEDGSPSRVENLNDRSAARLSPSERARIADVAGPLMRRLGYSMTEARVSSDPSW